jgi:hypothetical protein
MDRAQLVPPVFKAPPIIEEAADELTTGTHTTPDATTLGQTGAIEGPDESRDEVDSRSWRGVFAIEYPDEVLFTKRIDIRPDQLDEWRPEPVTSRRRDEHDD